MRRVGDENLPLGHRLSVLMSLCGVPNAAALARLMNERGYETSPQSINNYLRSATPPAGWMVAFIDTLGIDGRYRHDLIAAWIKKNPGIEELLRLRF